MTDLDELIDRFYELNYPKGSLFTSMFMHRFDGVPADMIVSDPNPHGRFEWKLVERSRGIDPSLDSFEAEIGHKLPEAFKLWNSRYYTLEGYAHILYLPTSPTHDPFREMRSLFFDFRPEDVSQIGLIPFGEERLGIGPLCFDTREPNPAADWPICYFEHDFPDDAIGPVIFSSFHKLLECCVHYLSGPGTDDWSRKERIPDFFDIDPTGAGDPGREYWEGWLED